MMIAQACEVFTIHRRKHLQFQYVLENTIETRIATK